MRRLVPALAAIVSLPSLAQGAEGYFVDARGTGMGGAMTAAVDNSRSIYYNPAVIGVPTMRPSFNDGDDKDDAMEEIDGARQFEWGVVDVGFGVALTGDLGEYIDDLIDVDYEALSDVSSLTIDDANEIITLATRLTGIDDEGNAILFDFNAGTTLQFGNWAIGARGFGRGTALVQELDTTNLGLNFTGGADLGNELQTVSGGDAGFVGSDSDSGSLQNLDASQETTLLTALGGNTEAVQYIDYLLTQAKDSDLVDDAVIDEAVQLLTDIADATGAGGGGDLEDNATAVIMTGLGVAEIPVAYGMEVMEGLTIGVTGKAMFGRVYGNAVLVFDDDASEAFDRFDENYQETTTFGVDVGILYRNDWIRLGAVGRNLNTPTFDGFTLEVDSNNNGTIEDRERFNIADVELEPQVTVGVALTPIAGLTLAGDLDLLETETVLNNFDSQLVKIGAEIELLRALSLRAGAYDNIAEDDRDPVITAGVGLDFYLLEIDIAGGISTGETIEYDGDEYPQEARFSFSLTSWF